MIQTGRKVILYADFIKRSQSSIRPGDDSDTRSQLSSQRAQSSRNPVFALEMIQTVMVKTQKVVERCVAIQYSPWR